MVSTGSVIPSDLWIHVAQFLSRKDLEGMLCVNSTFFHLVMDERYREIYFLWFGDRAMKKMQRLRDPAVAYRVRTLHVLVDSWVSEESVNRYLDRHKLVCSTPTLDYGASVDAVVQIMVDTVTCLSNVTEFTIGCTVLPYERHLSPFFKAAWETFRLGLRTVALRARLESFPTLLPAAGGLGALECLTVEFSEKGDPDEQDESKAILLSTLAPFINEAAPTLRSLSLSSRRDDLEISSLFHSLKYMPNLERLKISVYKTLCGLSDPLGLTHILRNHAATLRHVHWYNHVPREYWASSDPFVNWLEKNRSDKYILSDLFTLSIEVPQIHGGFDLVVEYLARSADTMTSLSLSGRHLSYDEVHTVTSIFAHLDDRAGRHLEELTLTVRVLSVELILHLSRTLPYLEKLHLDILSITGSAQETENIPANSIEDQMSNAREFAAQMREQDIRNWSLRDIGIFGGPQDNLSLKLVNLFAECVPSVRRCYGMDKRQILLGTKDRL